MRSRDLNLNRRNSFETFVRSFIKKGYKEKAFKIVLRILASLKFQVKQDPIFLLNQALEKAECRFELRVNKFRKPPKKQKGRPKLRGRLFHVGGPRVRRRAVKDLIKYGMSRIDDTLEERMVEEISAMFFDKGITLRKKCEFYESIVNARATIEVIKIHRRRKRINRL